MRSILPISRKSLALSRSWAWAALLIQVLPLRAPAQEQEDLKLFSNWLEWSNGGTMLMEYLNRQSFAYLDSRTAMIGRYRSKEDWTQRQAFARAAMLKDLGPFPARTPLHARVTGTVDKADFRMEKIVFESMPRCYVTGCLYIPAGMQGRRPAILYLSGHDTKSFRSPVYQRVICTLVRKGFIVFAIDPVGQGERVQYPALAQQPPDGGWWPTREHTYAGLQCLLTGTSLSRYFIWDGIRAIDYLCSRPEVDSTRIGATGRSGGGTMTAYIAAFDSRVVAAAPENYVTSHKRLLESRGPQDAEQDFYRWLADGTALEDLLVMQIPRPMLLVATTRDIFSIQGTREVYREVSEGYKAFGAADRFHMVEDHAAHASTRRNREAVYAFFQQYLGLPGDPADQDNADSLRAAELQVTRSGQVASSLGGETVFSLNRVRAQELHEALLRARSSGAGYRELLKRRSARRSGYHAPGPSRVVYRGSYPREGYSIAMYALETDEGYVVPLLLAVPDGGGTHPAALYIHPEGKEHDMAAGGLVEKMVRQGYVVAAPDLLGMGETAPVLRFPAEAAMEAMMIGRSLVGIQAGDIVRVAAFLRGLPFVDSGHLQAIAVGASCPALLHAAVYDSAIQRTALVQAPLSYYDIARTKRYGNDPSFTWGVAGALQAYDLPDLAACIAPRELAFFGILDARMEPAGDSLLAAEMAFPRAVYRAIAPQGLRIMPLPAGGVGQALLPWLRRAPSATGN